MRRIDEFHLKHPFMGARMLRDQLARECTRVGRRHVGTLMRRTGIEALAPQPGTSKAAPGNKIYRYLLRKLDINHANQVWALDTTYIPMAKGFVYLTAVVDVASRRVLTHKVAITLEAFHAREIIEEVFLQSSESPKSPTRIKAASSRPRNLPMRSWAKASSCRWTGAARGAIRCLSNVCGAA